MLINVFTYKGHTICIRAFGGVYEYLVSGSIEGTEYSETDAVAAGKSFVDLISSTPNKSPQSDSL